MDNLNEMGLVQLSSKEVSSIRGGRWLRFIAEYFFERVLDPIVDASIEYINDPDRQVDLNHARNGGWQQ